MSGHGHSHGTPGQGEQGGFGHSHGDLNDNAHHGHGHSHEVLEHAGIYAERPTALIEHKRRNLADRAFTVGIGGPVGSGKTALMLKLCLYFQNEKPHNIAAVTNDIFTREDCEFLQRHKALPAERIVAVETGGCPHAAIREDISANLTVCERLSAKFDPLDLILLESGGDNLAANFSAELADYIIYVVDVAGGDKVPRKGGPGVTQSDLLVINKTDLAEAVGADLDIMSGDAHRMRGGTGPVVLAQAKHNVAIDQIAQHILDALAKARE